MTRQGKYGSAAQEGKWEAHDSTKRKSNAIGREEGVGVSYPPLYGASRG